MNDTLNRIKELVSSNQVRISEHGYDELSEDDLTARQILETVSHAIPVEDYPGYPKGASVLVLQWVDGEKPVHVVWGIPRGYDRPAVLVTAYRPDPDRWEPSFMERKR